MIKQIDCGFFPFEVLFCIDETKASVQAYMKKRFTYKLTPEELEHLALSETVQGKTITLQNNAQIVMVKKNDIKHWVHELIHVSNFVISTVGLEPGESSIDEVQAHLVTHLFNQVYK